MTGEEKALKDVVAAFEAAWNRHDMKSFAELFSADADFVNVVGAWWKGRDEIRRAREASHEVMFRSSGLGIEGTDIRFLKPDVAVARARWHRSGHVDPRGANRCRRGAGF